ncbi:MAG: hypothetical protein ACK46Q_12765 [Hyphomonas sp.]
MSETKSGLSSISRAFPTEEAMAVWDALSPAEQRAFILRSEQAGFESGIAPDETLAERLARVRTGAA